MQIKVPAILLAVLAVLAGAWLLYGEHQSTPDNNITGQRLFPELEQQLNDITRIRVEHNGSVYEVLKKDDQWQLPDKGGYPVLFERVKPLLLGIARLDKVEAKTSRPENYLRLGVQEPSTDSGNRRITLYTAAGNAVASFISGNSRQGLIAGNRDGIYVRLSAEPGAWLVAGHLDLPQTQVDWVDPQIIHIKPKLVQRLTIQQPDGNRLIVEKPYRGAPGYSLKTLPEDTRKKNASAINALARGIAALKMEDIRIRPSVDPPAAETVKTVFETWDGLQISVTSVEQDQQTWAWFDLGGVTSMATDGLQERFAGWIFQLPASRAGKLRARAEDLGDEAH